MSELTREWLAEVVRDSDYRQRRPALSESHANYAAFQCATEVLRLLDALEAAEARIQRLEEVARAARAMGGNASWDLQDSLVYRQPGETYNSAGEVEANDKSPDSANRESE